MRKIQRKNRKTRVTAVPRFRLGKWLKKKGKKVRLSSG